MDTNQPTANPAYVQPRTNRGVFGTGIPATIAFAIGVLLFLLPFSEIKCGGTSLASKSGLAFAMDNKWKPSGVFGNKNLMGEGDSDKDFSKIDNTKEGNAKYFIWAAAALGILGLLLSFGSNKMASGGIVAGIVGGAALIGFMIQVKSWFKNEMAKQASDKASEGADAIGFGKTDVLQLSMSPWFYVAVIAFFAGAVFCFMRMRDGARH